MKDDDALKAIGFKETYMDAISYILPSDPYGVDWGISIHAGYIFLDAEDVSLKLCPYVSVDQVKEKIENLNNLTSIEWKKEQ